MSQTATIVDLNSGVLAHYSMNTAVARDETHMMANSMVDLSITTMEAGQELDAAAKKSNKFKSELEQAQHGLLIVRDSFSIVTTATDLFSGKIENADQLFGNLGSSMGGLQEAFQGLSENTDLAVPKSANSLVKQQKGYRLRGWQWKRLRLDGI